MRRLQNSYEVTFLSGELIRPVMREFVLYVTCVELKVQKFLCACALWNTCFKTSGFYIQIHISSKHLVCFSKTFHVFLCIQKHEALHNRRDLLLRPLSVLKLNHRVPDGTISIGTLLMNLHYTYKAEGDGHMFGKQYGAYSCRRGNNYLCGSPFSLPFVLPESVICILIFELQNRLFFLGTVFQVQLLRACVGMRIATSVRFM